MQFPVFPFLLLGCAAMQAAARPNVYEERAVCNADNCLRAVRASSLSTIGSKDCASFLGTVTSTVAAQTVTQTSTVTSSSTIVGNTVTSTLTSTTTVTATVSSTAVETVTEDPITSNLFTYLFITTGTTTTTTIIVPTGTGNAKRQVATTSTLPKYASACSSAARYLSACACIGVSMASTVTTAAAQATTVVTVIVPSLTTSTPTTTITLLQTSTITSTFVAATNTITAPPTIVTNTVTMNTFTVPAATSTVTIPLYTDFTISSINQVNGNSGAVGVCGSPLASGGSDYPLCIVGSNDGLTFRLNNVFNILSFVTGPFAGKTVGYNQEELIGSAKFPADPGLAGTGLCSGSGCSGGVHLDPATNQVTFGANNVLVICDRYTWVGLFAQSMSNLDFSRTNFYQQCGNDFAPLTFYAQNVRVVS